ncbi:MAG: hypothetical protein ACRDT4_05025 [Micromonosporaceae bacterium]
MAVQPAQVPAGPESPAPRTGPIGRAARLLLAAPLTWTGYDLWVDRVPIFTDLDVGLVLLSVLALYGAHQIGKLLGRGRETLIGLAVLGAAAATVSATAGAGLWSPPLSWLVWGVDLAFVAVVGAALLAAAVIGTPGCELGVFSELGRRLRRNEAMFCLVGLHKLDEWEERQPWRRP